MLLQLALVCALLLPISTSSAREDRHSVALMQGDAVELWRRASAVAAREGAQVRSSRLPPACLLRSHCALIPLLFPKLQLLEKRLGGNVKLKVRDAMRSSPGVLTSNKGAAVGHSAHC